MVSDKPRVQHGGGPTCSQGLGVDLDRLLDLLRYRCRPGKRSPIKIRTDPGMIISDSDFHGHEATPKVLRVLCPQGAWSCVNDHTGLTAAYAILLVIEPQTQSHA
jgi:hypothetical protein